MIVDMLTSVLRSRIPTSVLTAPHTHPQRSSFGSFLMRLFGYAVRVSTPHTHPQQRREQHLLCKSKQKQRKKQQQQIGHLVYSPH
jgi:hypothetical protein